MPLADVAWLIHSRAPAWIERRNGRRVLEVTADVNPIGETTQVQTALDQDVLPQLRRDFPGLSTGYEGRQADRNESFWCPDAWPAWCPA